MEKLQIEGRALYVLLHPEATSAAPTSCPKVTCEMAECGCPRRNPKRDGRKGTAKKSTICHENIMEKFKSGNGKKK